MAVTVERKGILNPADYIQASLWSASQSEATNGHKHNGNAATEVIPPLYKHYQAIQKALTVDRNKIEALYPGVGLDYEQLRQRIAADNEVKKLAKIGVRDELVAWLIDNDQDLQRTASGRKRRTATAVERAARRSANSLLRDYDKNPQAFTQLAAKVEQQGDQSESLLEIWGHIGIFRDESKRLNKKHRQASYYLRDAVDLLVWNDYLSHQDRIDRDYQQAQRLYEGTKQYVSQFNYYELFPARNSRLEKGIAKTNVVLTTFDLLVPKEVRQGKLGKDKIRRELVKFVQGRRGSTDAGVSQATLAQIAEENNQMLWRIGAGLGIAAGGVAVAMASLDAVTNQPDNITDVSLRAPQDEAAQEVNLTVMPMESPTSQLARIAHENVIVDIDAIPPIAETTTELVESPAGTANEIIGYTPVDLPEMTIPRAAAAILEAEQTASVDPTVQLYIDAFGDRQPPNEVKLPAGSNTAAEVRKHMIGWLGKLNKMPTKSQLIAAVTRALIDSHISDPYNLPPGFTINLSGVNEIMAQAIAENPLITKSAAPQLEAPAQPPAAKPAPAKPAAKGSGFGGFGVTQEQVESLRLIRDGRRYSCMERLDAIEKEFADLGPGVVMTMNGIVAAESNCVMDAVSYAGSEGPYQIHRGSHQKWVEERFKIPFGVAVREIKTASKIARQIYNWQRFEAWDVCGLGYKKFIKPVLDCLRLTR